jgi:nucleoside-diphosphate-sugar epimerase
VRRLLARGADVVALARSDAAAGALQALAAAGSLSVARGDVTDNAALRAAVEGADLAFHVAGVYRIGIKPSARAAMFEANVEGTRAVLDATVAGGVSRIVYVSTVGVFGNTRGHIVDETYERPDRDFLSYYDATKYLAHTFAAERAAAGAPLITVQPGAIYGPGDHSELGQQIEQARRGRYRVRMFPALGVTMSYVDDVADGVVLAADKGAVGEAYVLGGEVTRLGTVLDVVADLSGRRRARGTLPPAVMKAAAPLGKVIGPLAGVGPDLRETIRASDGVTYWASSEKAKRELGYAPRALSQGLCDLLGAAVPG